MRGRTYDRYSTVSFAHTPDDPLDPGHDKCSIDLRSHESYCFDATISKNHNAPFRGIGSASPFL